MTVANASKGLRVVNVAELSGTDDRFVTYNQDLGVTREVRLTGLPQNALERLIKRPRIARYRAALEAAAAAGENSIVITHMTQMAAAVSNALTLFRRRAPHLAFSFSFSTLPTGATLNYFKRAMRRIDQFTVFSKYEQQLYADYFSTDPAKIQPVIWTQDAPPVSEAFETPNYPYVCAIGGEGRDFPSLIEALTQLKQIRAVLIVRPGSLEGLSIPPNVQVYTNLPLQDTWRMACDSLGVLAPLKSRETTCGHVTIVSAKLLGIPVVTTQAFAADDYINGREFVLACPPGDAEQLQIAITRLVEDNAFLRRKAFEAKTYESALHSRSVWDQYVNNFIKNHTDRHI